jgi:hypothetical protein
MISVLKICVYKFDFDTRKGLICIDPLISVIRWSESV